MNLSKLKKLSKQEQKMIQGGSGPYSSYSECASECQNNYGWDDGSSSCVRMSNGLWECLES